MDVCVRDTPAPLHRAMLFLQQGHCQARTTFPSTPCTLLPDPVPASLFFILLIWETKGCLRGKIEDWWKEFLHLLTCSPKCSQQPGLDQVRTGMPGCHPSPLPAQGAESQSQEQGLEPVALWYELWVSQVVSWLQCQMLLWIPSFPWLSCSPIHFLYFSLGWPRISLSLLVTPTHSPTIAATPTSQESPRSSSLHLLHQNEPVGRSVPLQVADGQHN